jgi:hypothetical protein
VIDGAEGRIEATAPTHPHTTHVTVRSAGDGEPLAERPLPARYDAYPELAGTAVSAMAHAYAAVRDDLRHGTRTAPDFAHAVTRHRRSRTRRPT